MFHSSYVVALHVSTDLTSNNGVVGVVQNVGLYTSQIQIWTDTITRQYYVLTYLIVPPQK